MTDIINLRRARKAKARAEADAQATINRAAFGRSKQEKQAAKADVERLQRNLDGAKRER